MKKTSRALANHLRFGILIVGLCIPATGRAGLVAAWGGASSPERLVPANAVKVKSISAGSSFSLALRTDGRVVAWGANGATNVPAGLADVIAVDAGRWHGLALKANGTVVAWGDQTEMAGLGQTNVPPDLSDVVSVAAAHMFSLALKADGTVVSWGVATNVPPGLSNVIAITTGSKHALALKGDGTVVAWGSNGDGQANVPVGLSNVIAVAGGEYHSAALKSDGTVVAWGSSYFGQTNVPTGLSNATAVACGSIHSLALRSDGTVVAWGSNTYNQTNVPSVLRNVTAIAAGAGFNLALVHDGPPQIVANPQSMDVPYLSDIVLKVTATGWEPLNYRWFRNGQPLTDSWRILGTWADTLIISPAEFSDIGTYTVVVSNAFGSVISTGAVLTVISPPFITSQSATNQTVRAGTDLTLSASADGTPPLIRQWFFNGTILAGKTNYSLALTNVQPGDSGIYSLLVTNLYGSTQAVFSLTVTDSPPYILRQPYARQSDQSMITNPVVPIGGSVTLDFSARGSLPLSYQWRFNGEDISGATNASLTLNQLKYEQAGFYNVMVSNPFGAVISAKACLSVAQVLVWSSMPFNIPTKVPSGLTNAVAVAVGNYHVLALKSDGRVAAWSANYAPIAATNVPASVTNVVAIAAVRNSSMALRANGSVAVWGDNPSITNVPASVSNVMAIAIGGNHCLVLRSNGTVFGWGNNNIVQTNILAGLSNVVGIAAGSSHGLALRAGGTVVAWGDNIAGQTNVPAGLSNVIAIAAGWNSCLALRSNGTLVAWGTKIGDIPPGLSNVVAMAAGNSPMALRGDGSVTNWGMLAPRVRPALTNVIAIASGTGQEFPGFFVALVGNGSPAMTLQPVTQTATKGDTLRLHARVAGVQPMSYQWQLNGADLPAATGALLVITNIQGKDTGGYRMVAANALGSTVSATAWVTMPFSTNLPAALNATNRDWTTSPTNAAWFAQIRETHDGDTAAQSGPITHNQQSFLQTTVNGPGTVSFWWKVSSEAGFDYLKFSLDGNPTPLAGISGKTEWELRSFVVPPGTHVLKWSYAKDGSVSDGQDAGWLDEVVFVPPPPTFILQPRDQMAWMGSVAKLDAYASGMPPVTFQWLKNGTYLPGATSEHLALANVTRRDGAVFALRASNLGGSVLSSNATLKVLVPQRLQSPVRFTDGSLLILSGDADDGALSPEDLADFEVQTSTNLVNWVTWLSPTVLTNGMLMFSDPNGAKVPARFYRILERQ